MKKSYKEVLILLLQSKNEAIKDFHNGLEYIKEADLKEVLGWEEELCKRLVLDIKNSLEDERFTQDVYLCPWCLINYSYYNKKEDVNLRSLPEACDTCSYGERNGRCVSSSNGDLNRNSLYCKLVKKPSSIVDIPNVIEYMKEVLKEEVK